uniref:Ionotropic glutamate receptor L-glutamate and glycine-binding domain-containing protein n=1 Tax=Clytia hemisphaerica TaxID=252671 RepID=A0A7M5V4X0_9CNID
NGMIGELVAGRADVALQSLSVTYQRQRVVDFVPYLLTSNFGLIRSISRTDQKQSFKIRWDFATALSTMLAASFLCATILVIVFLYVHENLLHWLFAANVYFPIGEIFTYTLGLAFQRDMGALNPRQWSGRLVALGYAAAMTVFMSAYTAKICASSIDNQPLDDFKGFSGPEVNWMFS